MTVRARDDAPRAAPLMPPERRPEVDALFDAALDQAPSARAGWLEHACVDPQLRGAVARLLAAHERAEGLLDRPAAMALRQSDFTTLSPAIERVGRYRVVREIGRGGMGTVYLAERDDGQFQHRVAVKVLRAGVDADDLVHRFVAERQILATLEHQNVARLLDGGATSDGRPFYVMEYVEGDAINVYCDRRRLTVAARLRLFCTVARAVQYAHRSLVVHRDLKPSNILVTHEGQVKLLDFGIAKLLDPTAPTHAAPLTRTGFRLMTPEYASPEQVLGEPVTTATDVYGLGLVLYELLTGRRAHLLTTRTARELERVVCHAEPARPSVVAARGVGSQAGDATPDDAMSPAVLAAGRDTTPPRLARALRGDLDRILACALHKEPDRRYASAEQLALDVERHLGGRAVTARGDSLAYRARKFVVRHRWAVAVAALFVAVLVGYAATVTVQAARIQAALTQARLEAEKAERVTAFTLGLFEGGDLMPARGDSLTVRALLSRSAARADRLGAQPGAQAQMFDVVGRVYQRLGDYAAAEPFLERALAVRRRTVGPQHSVTAESMHNLAALQLARGRYAAAESLYRGALRIERVVLGPRHPQVARTLDGIGMVLQNRGDFAAAERASREALELRRVLFGREHPEVAASLTNLAFQLQLEGRPREAEPLYREALGIRRRLYGGEHPEVAASMSSLGLLLVQRGALAPAESLYRDALAMRHRLLGDDHPDVAASLGLLGALLRRRGDVAAAESVYHKAIATGRSLGDEHPDVIHAENGLALVLRDQGRYAAADSLYQHVIDVRRRVLGPAHPAIAMSLTHLGALRAERGDVAAAESLFVQALAMRRVLLGELHPQVAESQRQLAELRARPAPSAPRR